ncbi:MAG: hypothetical protein MK212_08135 [Saprospiraceae bacterium]|nr:hypothetical protein [Saprospiraceae bacterium]
MKKFIGFFIVLIVIGFFYIQMNKNSITVIGNSFDTKDLKIQLYAGPVIYQSGRQVADIPKQYGGIDFLVYYKDDLIGQAGIHSTNNWHQHHFTFDFSRTSPLEFDFRAQSPDQISLCYKQISYDTAYRIQTSVFYDRSGLTGQINKDYYDENKQIIVDETWKNDLLKTVNTYKDGNFLKSYCAKKTSQGANSFFDKIDSVGFLVYDYYSVTLDTATIERIIIER